MKLTLPEPPSSNRFWRHVGAKVLLSAEARQYKQDIQAICLVKRIKPIDGPLVFTLVWYRGRRSGDLDNRLKQVIDSLCPYAYTNDAQIVELHAYRIDRPRHPGVEVTIEAAHQKEP